MLQFHLRDMAMENIIEISECFYFEIVPVQISDMLLIAILMVGVAAGSVSTIEYLSSARCAVSQLLLGR